MFDRMTLTPKQMKTLNRAYVQIRTCGIYVWATRYKAITDLPEELLNELEEENSD